MDYTFLGALVKTVLDFNVKAILMLSRLKTHFKFTILQKPTGEKPQTSLYLEVFHAFRNPQ